MNKLNLKEFYLLAILVFTSFSLTLKAQCGPDAPSKVPLGAGLNGLADWDRDRPFNDVFLMNRGMSANIYAPWDYVIPDMDAEGWPLQDFGVVVMVGMMEDMGGTYKIRFKGQADIAPLASGFTVQNKTYDAATNTTTANLKYANSLPNGDQMIIAFTNTQYASGIGGIKNIRIMKPGLNFNAPTFSQTYLDHLQRFSVLRFMDWHSTNGNADSLWTDRTLTTSTSQCGNVAGSHGVAWEYVIELANTLHKDIWINIPHKADDNYVAALANMLKSDLDTGIHVYVEYSNEVWNWGFEQSHWNLEQGIIAGNTMGNPINYDNVNDTSTWHMRRYALRAKQISDIFKFVFGADAINNQIRVVYGTQVAWIDFSQRGLEFINNYYGEPNQFFYGIGVAPYFNSSALEGSDTASKEDILNALQEDVNQIYAENSNLIEPWAARAAFFRLKLMAYEGGPDTFGGNNITAKRDASRDPQMKEICKDYLDKWYSYGNDNLFNWFVAGAGNWETQYGTWSLTENFENSEKLQAMDEVLDGDVPVITAGQKIPGEVDSRRWSGHDDTWEDHDYFQPFWMPFQEYLIRVPEGDAGTYSVTFELRTPENFNKFVVYLDNQLLDTIDVPNTGSWNGDFATSVALETPFLMEGLHALRLKWITGQFRMGQIEFDKTLACVETEVPQINTGSSVHIYPNPASNFLHLEGNMSNFTNGKLLIFDATGRLVLSQSVNHVTSSVDVSGLQNGIYFYELLGSDQTKGKVIILRD